MRRSSTTRYVDRPILLRAVAKININGLASARSIAEELRIPQEDARELLAGEVAAGFLTSSPSPADCKYRFVVYSLTAQGQGMIGAAA